MQDYHQLRLGRTRFPALRKLGWFYLEFWLALKIFSFLWLIIGIYSSFDFTTLNRKTLNAQGIYENTTTSTEKKDYMASCDKTVI